MKLIRLIQRYSNALTRKRPLVSCRLQTRHLSTEIEDNIIRSPHEDVTWPNHTVPDMVWESLEKWPDKIALECGVTGKSYSYIELKRISRRFSVALLKSGLRPGDVVTAVSPNVPEYVSVILGTMDAGLTFTGINPVYSPDEIVHQMKDTNSNFVVVHKDLVEKILKTKEILGRDLKILCIHDSDGSSLPDGVHSFNDFIGERVDVTDGELNRLRNTTIDMESVASLPFSSGTTGLPKGVHISHRNLAANLSQASYFKINQLNSATPNYQDSMPLILPLFHAYGCVLVLMKSLLFGVKLITLPKFDPEQFLRILSTNENVKLTIVPPIINFLANHPSVTPRHLERVEATVTGGAPCSGEDIEKLLKKKHQDIIQGYGMTEAAALIALSDVNSKKYASIGKIISNTEAKVVDIDSGKALPAHRRGEICIRGPQIMKGYHNRPEATASTLDAEGWLHTGDVGYYDDDEDLYVVDRIKELIKVKGYQVAPAELEAVLRKHPDVYEAAITAVPNTRTGEAPIAFVVLKPGSTSVKDETLKQYVAEKVAPFKQISKIVFVDSVPKSSTGKLLRRQLKEEAIKYAE